MSYPKIAKLVDVLLSQTESGVLRWAATEKSDMFQASFPRYSVRLYPHERNPIEVDYILQILNELGDIVEEVSDPDLRSVMERPFDVMRRLHDAARRSAMGVETALDDILNFLEPF
ncbi:hypothetical protein [Pseudomonas sp. RA_5y_Pfl1_P24]|uniref:hypothetical protein n=1 Tax=Pseudomonas sp. RA_5y_Pfl1_P24 TaxID=3088706 RepID=UPI0030DA0C85